MLVFFSTLVSSPKDIAYIHPVSILSKSDITFAGENFDSMCLEIPGYKTEINALSDIKARVILTVDQESYIQDLKDTLVGVGYEWNIGGSYAPHYQSFSVQPSKST